MTSLHGNRLKDILAATSLLITGLLSGCGMAGGAGSSAGDGGSAASVPGMKGQIHGGNLPISGATVTIYVAGINTPSSSVTGYGSGATAVAHTTTDSTGSFNFPSGSYTCPSPTREAYIVSSGGNPGLTGTVNNTGAVLMAAIGPCPAGGNLLVGNPSAGIPAVPYITIDEVTTVAAVWALQQFMAAPATGNTGAPNIGAPNTAYSNGLTGNNALSVQSAVIGMNNAFTTASILADVSTGLSPNTNYSYATPESAKINTLADIIAACVNTDPTQSTTCANLFGDATPGSSSTTAADTVQALWYMAQNPTNNLTTLYGFINGQTPFLPDYSAPGTLSGSTPSTTAFNDATIAVNYAPVSNSAPVVGKPFGLAVDAYGNVWISNQGQTAVTSSSVTVSPSATVGASVAEIGPNGNVLLAPVTTFPLSTTGGSASKFTVAQPTNSRTVTTPVMLAIDLTDRAWFVNGDTAYTGGFSACSTTDICAGDVGVFSASSGAGVAGGTTTTGYLVGYGPYGIAIDGSDNVFVSNEGNTSGGFDSRSVTSMSALDGSGFTVSTASSGVAPHELSGGSATIAVDTNPNVAGGIVWVPQISPCAQAITGTTSVDFGVLNLYSATNITNTPSNSDIGTAYDPDITTGAGTTTGTTPNCNATNVYIGQVLPSYFTGIEAVGFDRNNGIWLTDTDESSPATGFDGLTYMTAPAPNATTGLIAIPSSTTLVNGVASSTSNGNATVGTTLQRPEFVEVDGNNDAWITVNSIRSVVEASVNTSGSSPVISLLTPGAGAAVPGAAYGLGFVHNTINSRQLGIDPSGNVWITNQGTTLYVNQSGTSTSYDNSLTVIVGAAGPVITPMSLRLHNTMLGQKP